MSWLCDHRLCTRLSTSAFSPPAFYSGGRSFNPGRAARNGRAGMIPYLFLADFQNTALSAFLVFCDRVVYPTYETVPRITSLTALEDQAAAGAMMWVAGSVFFLIPVGLITIELLSTRRTVRRSIKS